MADKKREDIITHLQVIHTWASFAVEKGLSFDSLAEIGNIAKWTEEALEVLKESDRDAILRILGGCSRMKGHWQTMPDDEGGTDLVIRDFSDSVTMVFDKDGHLIA